MDTRDGSDDCAVSTVVARVTAAKRAKALWGVKSRFHGKDESSSKEGKVKKDRGGKGPLEE